MKQLHAFLFSLGSIFTVSTTFADWNQWRGPNRDGVVVGGEMGFPDSLSEEKLIKLWSTPLAEGYSAPITLNGRLYTFETKTKENEILRAFSLDSGRPIWDSSWAGSMKVPFFAAKNGSWVRSTPTANNEAVYAGGMKDVLVKFDASTGDELWRIDFTKRDGTDVPSFGQVGSPLYDDGHLFVQAGLAVAKINAETGETIWRAMEDQRAMFGSAFSSPVIATLAGKRQLIVQARLNIAGLDLKTGEELWNLPVKAFRGMNILTPTIVGENRIFTASYGGGSFLFEISQKDQGKFKIDQVWNNEKLEGYMGNPALIDGYIYLHGRDKKLHCIDMATGEAIWSTDEEFGEYWSMVQKANRILSLDQRGELLLFEASPDEFKPLDRRKISPKDPTWAHIGLDGNRILIRSLSKVTVYQWN
ncbi:MAG: pyrrolo-quinoline quinone [Verrucomicrobiales bacterium]|nr:pyrrolo-quinoline quinone [Verrucomicrobiales bacterium]|tara:strand:- start:11685 stop:12935 length:1251 start_codon:yes stop_codon:yes gene_type:complete